MSLLQWLLFLFLFQLALVRGFYVPDFIKSLYNDFYAKCTGVYFKKDLDGLAYDLNTHLFGQPLVNDVVVNALRGHLSKKYPSKPLALSFHGWTGSGKNYVSDFIIKNLYAEGHDSSHVHLFVSKIHFPLEEKVRQYQIDLRNKIMNSVSSCEHSIFVFDEVDKYPEGVLDAVKPFLDYKVMIDGVNYRHAIFIFLSNAGSNVIVERTLDLWRSGKRRDDFHLRDFEKFLTFESFNERGGFYKSDIIDSHLIDHFVPFLPLEEAHVHHCIEAELKKKGFSYRRDIADEVIKDLSFGPEPENIFSVAGCKRVSQRVDFYTLKLRVKKEL